VTSTLIFLILYPSKFLFIFLLSNPYFVPSITIRNNKGDNGQPCLSPLPGLKKIEVDPFIKMQKESIETKLVTQLKNYTQNPNVLKLASDITI
jgi:hypothetical protein